MKNNFNNIIIYLFVFLVVFICLRCYHTSELFNLKCVISTVDGNKYCIRERKKLKDAANLLAIVSQKCGVLVNHMKEKYPKDTNVERLVSNFNPKTICETLPTSELTAYSENKGEKIAFCLNKTKNGTSLIDINTLTFVAIHELGHLMTKSVGHKQKFWSNFKLLLENAKEINIYTPINYKKTPQDYCGMTISDNPYYDL